MVEQSKFVFTGSGGQGVITSAIILAEAAVLHDNLNAVQTQVYGAAARGGATRTDVIISDSEIHYPKVTQAHVLVCLTQEAYSKYHSLLRPGGLLITDPHYVRIEKTLDAVQKEIPMYDNVMEKVANPIVLNICMLGVVTALTGIVRPESAGKILAMRVPKSFLDLNRKAFELGLDLGTAAAA